MTELLVDTSVAVPLLLTSHEAHGSVRRVGGRTFCRAGRARAVRDLRSAHTPAGRCTPLAEPRRPPPARAVRPGRGIGRRVDSSCAAILADREIAGGATYDALIALAAKPSGTPLASRDGRAEGTYRRLGVSVELLI
jgi:hypothetical protein